MTDVSDFQRESYRIDEQIWDTIALQRGERALFLGLAADGAWVERAAEIGIDVTVVAAEDATIARVEKLGATAIRGSATMIPATENAYDVAVAMHYLHEIDPGFHTQVVSELARVGRRVVIVEPSPPADPLGKRIAALYGRAKRDEGQFESYQPIEYWRKLLAIVKADVWQQLITFTRVPPRHAVAETISLVLDALAIEELPERYLDELRALAARPDAQLLPLSRIALVGTTAGDAPPKGSAEPFRPNVALPPEPPAPRETPVVAPAPPAPPVAHPHSATAPAWTAAGFGIAAEPEPPEMPPPPPPHAAAPAIPPSAPFGAPFALPDEEPPFGGGAGPSSHANGGFGWSWEPPEDPSSA